MKTRRQTLTIFSMAAVLSAGLLLAGCGGGGGASSGQAGVSRASGALSFSFNVSKKSAARTAARETGKVPSNTASIVINVTSDVSDETISAVVTIDENGLGKATITNIPAGLNFVELRALDSAGAVVAHRTEAVMVQAGVTSPVTATLGVSITAAAFLPSSLTIDAGETVAWINDTSAPHSFELSEDCKHDFLKRGVLFCTLTTPGTYTYSDPGDSSFTGAIIVEGEAPASLLAANPAADKTIGLPPLEVKFSGAAVAIGSTGNTTYSWNFDDGETSSEQNPTHTFDDTGFYEVVLTVSNGSSSASEKINVVVQQAAEPGAAATLAISPSGLVLLAGGIEQFSAFGFDENDNEVDVTVTWTVSGGIGTITSEGVFTATTAGSGAVVATSGSLTASANVTVLPVACSSDVDCDDNNDLTLDACDNPGTSSSSCAYTTIACNTNADCDDGIALTLDACADGGTAGAACSHEEVACNTAADCEDNNALTLDSCSGSGASGSICSYTTIACNTDADCDDNDDLTLDACSGGGTLSAACVNTSIACNTDADCDDNDDLTLDSCSGGGTSSAACATTVIECNTDADCNDNVALTLDACSGGGTTSAACVNTSIACNTDADCDDGDTYTLDACANGGTVGAACSNETISCLSNTDCDDSNVFTADTCANPGAASAVCGFDPIACTANADCPDDGVSTTASECVNLVCAAVEISVMGTVTQNSVAVADAVVKIYNDTYEDITLTDANGAYYFTGVPSGAYYILATKQDSTLETKTVTVP